MSQFQIDHRARGTERPLIPRLMRHPVQNPHLPPTIISFVFIAIAVLLFLFTILKVMNIRGTVSKFPRITQLLGFIGSAVSVIYCFYQYFNLPEYNMGNNSLIAGFGALCTIIMLI